MALRPRRPSIFLAIAGVLIVAAVLLSVVVLNRDERDDPDARAPTQAPSSGPTVVFAEFGLTADRVYRAAANAPDARSLVTTVAHAPEWGINPALRASGSHTAYTVLPATARPARETPAELRLLDVVTGEQTLLASDADLLTAPVFDRAGTHVVYRSNGDGSRQSLVSVEVATGSRRVVHTLETLFGVYPVGFDADDALLFADLSTTGTDLYRLAPGGQPVLLLHASDQVARDWEVSPDGATISFVAPETHNERLVSRLHVVELDGTRVPVPGIDAAASADQFSPVWRPDSSGITVGREAYPAQTAPAVTYSLNGGSPAVLATPTHGYDVPLGWSEDGEYLAARSFDGTSATEPGEESLVVIEQDGQRHTFDSATEVLFLGWVDAGE